MLCVLPRGASLSRSDHDRRPRRTGAGGRPPTAAAFARNDAEAYFAAFSEDASFIFHNWPQPLRRARPKVVGALATRGRLRSAGVRIQQYLRQPARRPGDLQPRCRHRLRLQGTESLNRERETILFRLEQQEGRWLACHEHLSAMPSTCHRLASSPGRTSWITTITNTQSHASKPSGSNRFPTTNATPRRSICPA